MRQDSAVLDKKRVLDDKLKNLFKYLQADPSNIRLISDITDIQLQLGQFDSARDILSDALKKHPDDASIRFRLATVAMASGEPEKAIDGFQALKATGITSDVLNYNLAYALVLARKFEEAKDQLITLVNVGEESVAHATSLLVRCYHHLGDLEKAVEVADLYIQKNPNNAEMLGIIALLNLDAGHSEIAKSWAQRAIELDKGNHEGHLTLGTLALENQNDDLAEEYFSLARQANPQSGRVWSGLGLARMLQLSAEDAIIDLKKAVHYMPNHIGTWHALAWAQIMMSDLQGAKESLDKAMILDRNFSETHGAFAVVAILSGAAESEVEPMIRRALGLNSNSFSARFARSLLEGKYDPKSAQTIVQEILDSRPSDSAGKTLGESLQQFLRNRATKH